MTSVSQVLIDTDMRANCAAKITKLVAQNRFPVSDDTDINVIDVEPVGSATQSTSNSAPKYKHVHCTNGDTFKGAIESKVEGVRIISFHSEATVTSIEARKEDFTTLVENHDINPLFLDAITALGVSPHPENGGSAPAVATKLSDNGSFECWYRLQYVEKHGRPRGFPWSHRHTAIYHKHDVEAKLDLILLFHPMTNSVLEQQLINNTDGLLTRIAHSPLEVHTILCQSYLENWQFYLQYHSESIETHTYNVSGIRLEEPIKKSDFETIKVLHKLRSRCAQAEVFAKGNTAILKKLISLPTSPQADASTTQYLTIASERSDDHAVGFNILQDQVRAIMNQFEYTVSYRDQRISADLAQTNAEDAKTMKTITLLGMIFLPGGFIASLFGMNFFKFADDRNELVVGRNWWVFLAFWLPSTLLVIVGVFAYNKIMDSRRRKQRALDEEAGMHVEISSRTKLESFVSRCARKLQVFAPHASSQSGSTEDTSKEKE